MKGIPHLAPLSTGSGESDGISDQGPIMLNLLLLHLPLLVTETSNLFRVRYPRDVERSLVLAASKVGHHGWFGNTSAGMFRFLFLVIWL